MAMWNKKVIPGIPVVCEMKINITPDVKDTLNTAYQKSKACGQIMQDHLDVMATEIYILKRLLYKCSNQFRSKKSHQGLKQMWTCVKRMDPPEWKSVAKSLHLIASVQLNDASGYFPTRERVQYYLLRLKGIAALLTQLALHCQNNYLIVRQNLHTGDMVPHYVFILTLAARVWYVSRSLCTYICQWYEGFWPCLTHLHATNIPWLTDVETELPSDLKAWLLKLFPESALAVDDEKEMIDLSKKETDESEFCISEDLGEPIQRNSFRSFHEKQVEIAETSELPEDLATDISNHQQQQHPLVIKTLIKCLKGRLKTDQGVQDLKQTLQERTFSIGNFQFKLSKKDVRKILKKINTLSDRITASIANKQQVILLRKKLCRVVAKQLSICINDDVGLPLGTCSSDKAFVNQEVNSSDIKICDDKPTTGKKLKKSAKKKKNEAQLLTIKKSTKSKKTKKQKTVETGVVLSKSGSQNKIPNNNKGINNKQKLKTGKTLKAPKKKQR